MNRQALFLVAVTLCCAALCTGRLSAGVFAKANEAENLYGKGVHAFFDADYKGAVALLTRVEELKSEDPRPYFFLGLAQRRLKLNDEADATFKKAARLEWEGRSARDYRVSDALKRIQGSERLHIEKFRQQAKLDWEKADQKRRQELYGQAKVEARSILRTMADAPAPLPEPRQFVGVAPFGARSVDPQRYSDGTDGVDKLIPTDDATPVAVAKPKEDAEKPATMPAAAKDDADAFGTADEEMGDEMDDDDPFGLAAPAETKTPEPKKDDNDPFGMPDDDDEEDDEMDDDEEEADDDDDNDPFK